jgi:UDP-N-acetylglucosamine diphosphorylase/glucosamine-1-phosphate N-acetyltransferase
VGILTIREKWERMLGMVSYDKKEEDYKDLDRSVNLDEAAGNDGYCLMIHGNILPTPALVKAIRRLRDGEFISINGSSGIVFRFTRKQIKEKYKIKVIRAINLSMEVPAIRYPWDIFKQNDWAIRQDFNLLTGKRKSASLSRTNRVVKSSQVFLEKGARVEHCIINASEGPVYIGKKAEIMEGSVIRGPVAICEGACVKMGARVYGASTIGPYSVAGGEIKNSVIFGYSNKAHDGYLGDSVIGEWCNLGAGTSNSNLKNNAGMVRLWTPKGEIDAGTKCGVMMGDYSRTAINTSINTGTVIGVCCNLFGSGLTPQYIPSFSWGCEGIRRYEYEKALQDIENWKQLKGQTTSENEKSILKYIYDNY